MSMTSLFRHLHEHVIQYGGMDPPAIFHSCLTANVPLLIAAAGIRAVECVISVAVYCPEEGIRQCFSRSLGSYVLSLLSFTSAEPWQGWITCLI